MTNLKLGETLTLEARGRGRRACESSHQGARPELFRELPSEAIQGVGGGDIRGGAYARASEGIVSEGWVRVRSFSPVRCHSKTQSHEPPDLFRWSRLSFSFPCSTVWVLGRTESSPSPCARHSISNTISYHGMQRSCPSHLPMPVDCCGGIDVPAVVIAYFGLDIARQMEQASLSTAVLRYCGSPPMLSRHDDDDHVVAPPPLPALA